tara:strand:+ start:1337 stop:2227 length:891 start_codon:yes stop_codon:yes gene_type:complete
MYIKRDELALEILLRENIQKAIHHVVEEKSKQTSVRVGKDEQKLRSVIRNLIQEVKQNLQEQAFEGADEKEMFDLVKKEIAGLLKSSIKVLKDQQTGDPEQVQIGHLKAIILAINNLFDQVESEQGALERENLKEAIEVDIGDVGEDVTQNPLFMNDDAMENGGVRGDEPDIGAADEDEIEKLTMDLGDDDIQTLYDSIRSQDPENASYQILGAGRALNKKTGSWNRVKNNFINFAELVWGANLPDAAWKTFRKWVVENVRLHLINTIQETAAATEEVEAEELGGTETAEEDPLEF